MEDDYRIVKKFIGQNNIEGAIDLLSEISERLDEKKISNELVIHRSSYNQFKTDKRIGVLSEENQQIQYSKIRRNLLDLNEELVRKQNQDGDISDQIQVKLTGKPEGFSEEDEYNVRKILSNYFEIDLDSIEIKRIIRSSIIIVIAMPLQSKNKIIRRGRRVIRNSSFESLAKEYLRNNQILEISHFPGIDEFTLYKILEKDVQVIENQLSHLKIDLDAIIFSIRENLNGSDGVIGALEQAIGLYKQMIEVYKYFDSRVHGLPYQDFVLTKLKLLYTQSELFSMIFTKFHDFTFLSSEESTREHFREFNSEYSLLWNLLKNYRK